MLFEIPGLNLGDPKTEAKKYENKPSASSGHQKSAKKLVNNEVSENLTAPKYNNKSQKHVAKKGPISNKNSKAETPQIIKNSASPKVTSHNIEKHSGKSKLQQKMEEKLRGARFRYLNQKLYQSDSREAFNHFKEHPEDFDKVV